MTLTKTSITLSAVGECTFRSRWTIFHPLSDWDSSGQHFWATPLSSCCTCISRAREVSACLSSFFYLFECIWPCLIWQFSLPLSLPGEGLAAAEDGPLSNVAMPVSPGVTCEMGLVDVKDIVPDQAACIVSEAVWSNCKVTHLYF